MKEQEQPPAQTLPAWPALTATAADAGVDEATWTMQCAAVLFGLSGPGSGWDDGCVTHRDIAPNLLLPSAGILQGRLHHRLLDYPRILQTRLQMKSGSLVDGLLLTARFGYIPGKQDALLNHPNYRVKMQVDAHGQTILLDREKAGHGLVDQAPDSDFGASISSIREESVRRPSYLLENPRLPDLPEQISKCHMGRALVSGGAAALLMPSSKQRKTKGRQAPRSFAECLAGFDYELAPVHGQTPLGGFDHAQVSAVLSASRDELARLASSSPALLERFLVLKSAPSPPPVADPADLPSLYLHAVKSLLKERRSGEFTIHRMRDAAKARQFRHQCLRFLQKLEGAAAPVTALAGVPEAVAWTIMVLYPKSDVDNAILRIAVRYAEVLLEGHLAAIEEAKALRQIAENCDKERIIVQRIRERGPMRHRELMRTFSDQRKCLYEPAIKRLLAEGVLTQDEDGRLCAGPMVDSFAGALETT